MSFVDPWIRLRYGISDDTVLNAASIPPPAEPSSDPEHLGTLLRQLKAQAGSSGDEGLDYGAVAGSDAYSAYCDFVLRLRTLDPMALAFRESRLAFWINLYNGLVLDAIVQWKVKRSAQEVPGFFWRAAYNIGGLRYSASDIENGILRGNAAHPALPGVPFGRADPRRAHCLPRLDPRVHFALVCASRSCPPIAVYTPERIDVQLDQATRSFVRGGGVEVDPIPGRVRLSHIFQWYAVDFGAHWQAMGDKRALLKFVAGFLDPTDSRLVLARRRWKVAFMPYDWSLNGLPA